MWEHGIFVAAVCFLTDILLILESAHMVKRTVTPMRVIFAGLISAVYTLGCVLPGAFSLFRLHWYLAFQILVSCIAFGCSWQGLLSGSIFVLMRLVLSAVALGIGNGGQWTLLACAAAGLCGWFLCRRKTLQGKCVPVTLTHKGKTVELTALVDSGNQLVDPISGDRVLVVDGNVALVLLGLSAQVLEDPLTALSTAAIPGLRLIPYSSVDCPGGLMLGIRMDQVCINGEQVDQIVAFAPQRIGRGREYDALAGGVL